MKEKNRNNFNNIIQKIQKGGAFAENECIQSIAINIFLFMCYNAIFICLFKFSHYYDYMYYLLIGLLILSFFTFIILLKFNPFGKFLIKFFITRDSTNNNEINYINLIASFLLSSTHLLQFVSVILIFLVFYSNKPPSNDFNLTTTNANNIFYYEIFYIYSYLSGIILLIIVSAIDNNICQGFFMKILSGLITLIACGLVAYMFYLGYQTYYNVFVKGNQLFQGSPNNTVAGGPTGAPKTVKRNPAPTIPVCTAPLKTLIPGKTKDPNDECYK
jgi:hypothetical protein